MKFVFYFCRKIFEAHLRKIKKNGTISYFTAFCEYCNIYLVKDFLCYILCLLNFKTIKTGRARMSRATMTTSQLLLQFYTKLATLMFIYPTRK